MFFCKMFYFYEKNILKIKMGIIFKWILFKLYLFKNKFKMS